MPHPKSFPRPVLRTIPVEPIGCAVAELKIAYHSAHRRPLQTFPGRTARHLMARLILKSAIFSDGNIQFSTGDLPVSIGRSHRADITINDLLLSRIHSEIRLSEKGGFEIVDCESTNLTIVNDQDIERAVLKTGDRILLGDTELLVEIEMPDIDVHERTTRELPVMRPPENP